MLCDALRLNGSPGDVVHEILSIHRFNGLFLEGIFTHFATSDERDKTYARRQFTLFQTLLKDLETAGVKVPLRHAANSGAIIDMPETHLDMVRAGISVYGLYPSPDVNQTRIRLKPVLTLKAKIIHLKEVPAGTRISYGGTHVAKTATTVATVAAGYGDGYNRRLSNCGHMLVRGRPVPIIGRVCMDLTMIDVGAVPGVCLGDEAVLIGRQGEAALPAEALAEALGTINYEVVTALTPRVPRIYINKG
jgi:alanine racemase